MAELRWGICSAGRISQDFATVLSLLDHHRIVAVAARNLDRAQALASAVGAGKTYDSYEALAADPDIDIVHIGSVNMEHARLCHLFLKAKKHVLCEAPLGMNAEDVASILAAAKESGRFFMEGLWTRFFPAYVKTRSLIAEGELGEIKLVTADFCADTSSVGRVNDKAVGGGGIYGIGVYLVQLATMVFGENPMSVNGVGGLTDTGVDEVCSMTLKYPGNKMAVMTSSIRAFGNNGASIIGTKGRIVFPMSFHTTTKMELIRGYPAPGMFKKQVFEFPEPPTDKKFNYLDSSLMHYQAEAVRQAIAEGKTEHPVAPWTESLAIAKILEKLRQDVGYYFDGEKKT